MRTEGRCSGVQNKVRTSQACGGGHGCMTCPLMFKFKDDIIINGQKLYIDKKLSCKSKNCIYIAQCQVCASNEIVM